MMQTISKRKGRPPSGRLSKIYNHLTEEKLVDEFNLHIGESQKDKLLQDVWQCRVGYKQELQSIEKLAGKYDRSNSWVAYREDLIIRLYYSFCSKQKLTPIDFQ